jgi:hypothetical protein
MPAVEKRGLLEDVLAILDRTPGVENVGYLVPYPVLASQNADESIGTLQVDSVSGDPAAAVGAPLNATLLSESSVPALEPAPRRPEQKG